MWESMEGQLRFLCACLYLFVLYPRYTWVIGIAEMSEKNVAEPTTRTFISRRDEKVSLQLSGRVPFTVLIIDTNTPRDRATIGPFSKMHVRVSAIVLRRTLGYFESENRDAGWRGESERCWCVVFESTRGGPLQQYRAVHISENSNRTVSKIIASVV